MTQASNNNVNRNPANNPERNVHLNESYEDYCIRRQTMKKAEKALKRGTEYHDSSYAGQHENPAKRALQAERKARRNNKRAV